MLLGHTITYSTTPRLTRVGPVPDQHVTCSCGHLNFTHHSIAECEMVALYHRLHALENFINEHLAADAHPRAA